MTPLRSLAIVVPSSVHPHYRQTIATYLRDHGNLPVETHVGRTPEITGDGGRNHYPKVFSTLLAGAGVKGGFIYGSSDKEGASVADKQASIQDFHSTIGHVMGMNVNEVVMSPSNRPFTVGDKGTVLAEVLA